MIGLRLMNKIHKRLCEAVGTSDHPFGGLNIYLFGDLRQLPPVKDLAIYMPPGDDFSSVALALVRRFQKIIILSIGHRQLPSQERFKQVLDSLATGNVAVSDWEFLMQRRRVIAPHNVEDFSRAIHLFPTNNQVVEHNTLHLSQNRQAVALIPASHNNATARQGSDTLAGGLSSKLYLSVGCRIMLRKNLCVEKGLVNGALGTVRDIKRLEHVK